MKRTESLDLSSQRSLDQIQKTTTNAHDLIDIKSWIMVFAGACFYAYQYILRVSPNMMTDELMEAFSIDATGLGFFSSTFYVAYSLALIPLGLAMDFYGPKYLLVTASLLCALGCELFAITRNPLLAGLGRFLIGLGAANGFLGTLKLGTVWLPPQSFGKVIALTLTLGTLGAVVGGAPFETTLNTLGWKNTVHMLAFFGVILSIFLYLFVGHKPLSEDKISFYHMLSSLLTVIRSSQVWLASLYGMLMYVPIIVFGDLWGVSFLERLYSTSEVTASKILASLFFGMAIGSPCFAFFSDWIKKRKPLMIISGFLCTASYSLIIFYPGTISPWVMHGLFFFSGFFYGGKSLGFATVVEVIPQKLSGIAVGFSNMIIMAAGVFTLPAIGYILDLSQDSIGSSSYTLVDFRLALSIIPIGILFSVGLSFFIHETYPKIGSKNKI